MAKFDLNDLEQFEQFVGETKKKIEITNSDGDTAVMELAPLESRYIGKLVYVQENFPRPRVLNPHEVKAGREPRYESDESFRARMTEKDYDSYGAMTELLSIWVKQSYPKLPIEAINKFVLQNITTFSTAFMEQHSGSNEETGETKEVKDFIKMKREAANGGAKAEAEKPTDTN